MVYSRVATCFVAGRHAGHEVAVKKGLLPLRGEKPLNRVCAPARSSAEPGGHTKLQPVSNAGVARRLAQHVHHVELEPTERGGQRNACAHAGPQGRHHATRRAHGGEPLQPAHGREYVRMAIGLG